MPNKNRGSKGGKNDEKKVYIGLPQQQPNVLDNYLIKPPGVAAVITNVGPAGNRKGPVAYPVQERFHSNRFMGQQPGAPHRTEFSGVTSKSEINLPLVGQKRPESEHKMSLKFPSSNGQRNFSNFVTSSEIDSEKPRYLTSNNSSEESVTPKPDIISYYRARGLDYFEVRKKSRQYLSRRPSEFSPMTISEKLFGGAVYCDEYSPPPGYTWKDLEGIPIPEDPIPESPQGNQISPCVLKAANLRLKKRPSVSPIPSSQNFQEILEQLESIGANRDKYWEEKRLRKQERRKQKQAMIENENMEIIEAEVANDVSSNANGNDCEFPNDEDSFVQRATQLEERVVETRSQNSSPITSRLCRSTKNNSRVLSPRNFKAIGGNTPVTSGGRLSRRTKLKHGTSGGNSLKRPPGRLDFSNESSESPVKRSSATTSPDSEDSIFEKSNVLEIESKNEEPHNSAKVVIGDFADDDDDDVFTQMPMPEVPQQHSAKSIPDNEKSTVVVTESSTTNAFEGESFLTADVLTALDLWEEKAIGCPSKVYTSTPMLNRNPQVILSPGYDLRSSAKKSTGIKTDNSSDMDTSTSLLNESKEKRKGTSRLSRSFVRGRK